MQFNVDAGQTLSPPALAWSYRCFQEAQAERPREMQRFDLLVHPGALGEEMLKAGDYSAELHATVWQEGDGEVHYRFLWPDGMLTLSYYREAMPWNPCDPAPMKKRARTMKQNSHAHIDFFTPVSPLTQRILDAVVKCRRGSGRRARPPELAMVIAQQGHLHLADMALTGKHRLQGDNYAPAVIDGFHRLRDFVRWRTPTEAGNLVLLDGPPGTGKTSLIRALITGVRAPYVLAAGATIASLEDPNFLPFILAQARERGGLVLILEDADSVILKREFTQDLGLLSSLLNATSGILGDLTKLRVIATVNTWNDDRVDDAVTRPGRLFQRISLGELPVAQARAVILRESKSELAAARVTEPMTLAAAYELARSAKPAKRLRASSKPSGLVGGLRLVRKADKSDDFEEV